MGLGTWCEVVCSVGPMALTRTSINAQPEPKDHNGAIMTWTARRNPTSQLWPARGAITQEGETLDARYCLVKYCCRTDLLMWELVPMPLLSHPLPTKQTLQG